MWFDPIAQLWSTTRFRARELSAYAEKLMVEETRRGVMAMSFLFLLLLFGAVMVSSELALQRSFAYTSAALAALSAHVYFAARNVTAISSLHALGMTLLIISGSSFVLLAHQNGAFGAAIFGSIVLLFMVIPLVPWGLREASIVTLLIYGLVSLSTWSVANRFSAETLWTLQLFMLAAGVVSLTLVARGTRVRKADIRARYQLETARGEMELLSFQDPLTKAWNRRFLEAEFQGFVDAVRKSGRGICFALLDIDRFKQLNDTHGHVFGDQVLQRVTAGFQAAAGDNGFVVRTGGDEFTLLLDTEEPEAVIEDAANRILASGAAGDGGAGPQVSLSIGLLAVPPQVPITLDQAYRTADVALYRAKGSGESGSVRVVRVDLGAGTPEGGA
jgi:diguanylate cyclase (GGDEF)-like protein